MAVFIRIRNKKTKVESDISPNTFDRLKHDRGFKLSYDILVVVNEPPEVVELRKRLAERAKH